MEKENNLDFTNAITLVHSIFKQKKSDIENQIFVDATCGNGNDTKFLSEIGYVYSFDIQNSAIKEAEKLKLTNVSYINDCHSKIPTYIDKEIDGAIFNLGYLPGGNKSITTKKESTIMALSHCIKLLKVNGLISIIIYPGHKNGKEEETDILNYLNKFDQKVFNVIVLNFINRINNSPYPILIERLRSENEQAR